MQRGIGKHGIKFMLKRQLLPIALHGMNAQALRRSHQIGAAVQAEHLGAGGGDFLREHAVAAAQIQYSLSFVSLQPIEQRYAIIGNKTGIVGISLRLPVLAGRVCLTHRLLRGSYRRRSIKQFQTAFSPIGSRAHIRRQAAELLLECRCKMAAGLIAASSGNIAYRRLSAHQQK